MHDRTPKVLRGGEAVGGGGEIGFFDGDDAGGAGEALEVGAEGGEQGGLADRGAELADAGSEEHRLLRPSGRAAQSWASSDANLGLDWIEPGRQLR